MKGKPVDVKINEFSEKFRLFILAWKNKQFKIMPNNLSRPEKMTKGLGCNSSVYTTGVKKYSSVVYTGG